MLKLRYKRNSRFKIKNAINAYIIEKILVEFKSRESNIFNFIYKKLYKVTLTSYDNNA